MNICVLCVPVDQLQNKPFNKKYQIQQYTFDAEDDQRLFVLIIIRILII